MNSVRRELALLTAEDIVQSSGDGVKRFFQANPAHPLFHELKALVFKGEVLEEQKILRSVQSGGRIIYLALTGFFVSRTDAPTDILIIGSVDRKKIARLMRQFQERFDRDIRYTVLTKAEYLYRSSLSDRFLFSVMDGARIEVINKLQS